MKNQLRASILVCVVLSLFVLTAKAQSALTPDTRIRGIVTAIEYDYQGHFFSGTYKLTAMISVRLNETLEKPETFTRERNQLVGVSYNYSSPPECRVNDAVEVYGLWVSVLDVPASQTTLVDDRVVGSYVEVMPPPLPLLLPQPTPTQEPVQPVSLINLQSEYSNGSIPIDHDVLPVLSLWYDWVNTQSTQVIFLAYHSEVYNSPIITFVGQRYATVNGTEVFVGNTLSLMEVYRDADENSVPETSEISYFLLVNSSVGFAVTPIQKIVLGDVAHYRWGVKYQTIDGFLIDENGTGKARVVVEHMAFSYDYHIQSNISYLKTAFDIGRIVTVEPYEPDLTLQGLSLSLVYATITISPKDYTVLVNGQPYNSTSTAPPLVTTNRTEVAIENQKTYEFLFGENYTLYRDSTAESHKSFSVASPTNTVSSNARPWLVGRLEHVLEDLFPKLSAMQTEINLDYTSSTFVYRVCYPAWGGCRIRHDPTYIAYINPRGLPPIPTSPPWELLTTTIVLGLVALIAALRELRRTKRQLSTPPASLSNVKTLS